MTELAAVPTIRLPDSISQSTAVEQARAVAEVAAAVQIAQQCPRNMTRVLERMREACRTPALADRAFYSIPRRGAKGGKIEGETVHFARELALCFGNVDHGLRELHRDDENGVSEILAWAWDCEVNTRASRSFIVPHARMVGQGTDKRRERLDDLAEISNNNNSVGARAVREVIFQVLPASYKDEAKTLAAKTLQGDGDGKTLDQRRADCIAHYRDAFGVTVEQLEARMDRKSSAWTPQDLGVLRVISGELARAEKTVDDEFGKGRVDEGRVDADEIRRQNAAAEQAASAPASTEPDRAASEPAAAPAAPAAEDEHPGMDDADRAAQDEWEASQRPPTDSLFPGAE